MKNLIMKNYELFRRAVTQISTETLKNDSRIPMDFVMIKDWVCLDGESEEHIDFKLPRIIQIQDIARNKVLFIHRVKEIEKTRIKTKDGDVDVYTTNIYEDEVTNLIRGFVREAYEHEQADSTKEDYWENIEEKINVVSDFLINTYTIGHYQSNSTLCIEAMEKQFDEKYCIESRIDTRCPFVEEITDLAQKKPHLLILDRRFTHKTPILEKKKAFYSDGSWDWDASVFEAFDENAPDAFPDATPVTQLVFLQPKK